MASKISVTLDEKKNGGKKATGTKTVKTGSSATTKAALDEKMARAQRLKEQQEAERKRKLEEKHAREAQRLEAMAQRRKEMSQKKESGKIEGGSKMPAVTTGTKTTKTVRANDASARTKTTTAKHPVKTTTSSLTRPKPVPIKTSTDTAKATGPSTARATTRVTGAKKPTTATTTKTSTSARPLSKPATTTTATRTTTSRTSTGSAGVTRKPASATAASKKPPSSKTVSSPSSRIKPPATKTTRDTKIKSPAKGTAKTTGITNKKTKANKEDIKKEEVKPSHEDAVSVEIEVTEQVIISSGTETEGSSDVGLSKPVPATSFTPSTASRVGEIIATKTSLSKDLQTRLPSAGGVADEAPGKIALNDSDVDLSDMPQQEEPVLETVVVEPTSTADDKTIVSTGDDGTSVDKEEPDEEGEVSVGDGEGELDVEGATEARLARVQSPGPELTLPDEFGTEWKREKIEQEMKDMDTREDRKKRVDEIMRKTRARGEELDQKEAIVSLSPTPPPPDQKPEAVESTSPPPVDVPVNTNEPTLIELSLPAKGSTPTFDQETTPPDSHPSIDQVDAEDIRSSVTTQDSFEYKADSQDWVLVDQPSVDTVQEEKAEDLVTFELGVSEIPQEQISIVVSSTPPPEEPSTPPPEEPSTPPPGAPSTPPPEEPSTPPPEAPSTPPPDVEDIEELDEPLVSFDAQATSEDVLLMLPEDNDKEIQQLVEDTAQRIERMETTQSTEVKQDVDLLSFNPVPGTEPVSSATDPFEMGGGVPTDDLLSLDKPEGAQETVPSPHAEVGVVTSDLLNLGVGEGNTDLLDSSEVD